MTSHCFHCCASQHRLHLIYTVSTPFDKGSREKRTSFRSSRPLVTRDSLPRVIDSSVARPPPAVVISSPLAQDGKTPCARLLRKTRNQALRPREAGNTDTMMKSQLQGASTSTNREALLSAQLSNISISNLPPLENRAAQSTSPYVRSHASSPIAWQILDDESIQRAKKENKLVFMNIGFKSCHCMPPNCFVALFREYFSGWI